MHRRKSHNAVGRWLFRTKEGSSQEATSLVGSSTPAGIYGTSDDTGAFCPDTDFPSTALPDANQGSSSHQSLVNSTGSLNTSKPTIKESSARSTGTKDTQLTSSLSIRSVVTASATDDKPQENPKPLPRKSFSFLDKNKQDSQKAQSRKSFSFIDKNKLPGSKATPRKSFSIFDKNSASKEGTPLSPTKRKKVLDAVLLLQDFESAPTTNVVEDRTAPILLSKSSSSLKSHSSRATEAPTSPVQSQRRARQKSVHVSRAGIEEIHNNYAEPVSPVQSRRRERQSVHVSRAGIEELDNKADDRRSKTSNRKSLSKSSREELEQLAKSIVPPMIPRGTSNNVVEMTLESSERTSDDDAEIIAAIKQLQKPLIPVRIASFEEAGTTSGECSEDGSVGLLVEQHKEKANDGSGKLGMSTVSLVLDDLKGDSQSGLPVSPLASPHQAPKRSFQRDQKEQEIQRLLANLRELNALSGSDEFHNQIDQRGYASTSRFDEYLSTDVYFEKQQQPRASLRANASMSYLNYKTNSLTRDADTVPATISTSAPGNRALHESYLENDIAEEEDEDDDDIVQKLLPVPAEYDSSTIGQGSSNRRASFNMNDNLSRPQVFDASAASMVFEDVFHDGGPHQVSPLPYQPSHLSPTHSSPHPFVSPNERRISPMNEGHNGRRRQSARLEQIQMASFSHHDDEDMLTQQEEEMIRIALERSLNDSRSVVCRDQGGEMRDGLGFAKGGGQRDWQQDLDQRGYVTTVSPDTLATSEYPGQEIPRNINPAVAVQSLEKSPNQVDHNDLHGNDSAYELHDINAQGVDLCADGNLLAVDGYNEALPLTQAEQELLEELTLEQELQDLQNSLSSLNQMYDDHSHRSHRSHQSHQSMSSGVVDSGILVSHSGSLPYQGTSAFLSGVDDLENDEEESALLAANAMIMQAQQAAPPQDRRVKRVSSTRSQSSATSHVSHGSHLSHASSRASFASRGSRASTVSQASRSSYVSRGSASTFDGRPRPVYDWERELIARNDDDMEASVDGVEGFYEDEFDGYVANQQAYAQGPPGMNPLGRQSSVTYSYGRQSSTSSGEPQHWARRPPGRIRSNDSNEGIEQFYVDTDQEPLSQHLLFVPYEPASRDTRQQLARAAANETSRSVSQAELEHLTLLEQEMMELALQRSLGGEFYENI